MSESVSEIYTFGEFRLDTRERTLLRGETALQLPPKVFDTLRMLVDNAGRVLSKERMLEEIWEGSFVEENNLAQNISTLRRILAEDGATKFIETVPKYGYRFVAPVDSSSGVSTEVTHSTHARIFVDDGNETELQISGSRSAELPQFIPETRYVQSGDANIAYQVVGEGDIDIVFVMGWVSHLEYFWKHHLFASFLNRLASFSRLILFDKRGTGISDPVLGAPSVEERMDDVRAVQCFSGPERSGPAERPHDPAHAGYGRIPQRRVVGFRAGRAPVPGGGRCRLPDQCTRPGFAAGEDPADRSRR